MVAFEGGHDGGLDVVNLGFGPPVPLYRACSIRPWAGRDVGGDGHSSRTCVFDSRGLHHGRLLVMTARPRSGGGGDGLRTQQRLVAYGAAPLVYVTAPGN
jgi:hypothetical protein